jgi:hypothetical protein
MCPLAVLHIQNIIPRRERYSIGSILIRCYTRDFFLFLLTHDDKRIFNIDFAVTLCRGISSASSTFLSERIFKCPCRKSYGAALIDALSASLRKMQLATRDLAMDNISPEIRRILSRSRPISKPT